MATDALVDARRIIGLENKRRFDADARRIVASSS